MFVDKGLGDEMIRTLCSGVKDTTAVTERIAAAKLKAE